MKTNQTSLLLEMDQSKQLSRRVHAAYMGSYAEKMQLYLTCYQREKLTIHSAHQMKKKSQA